MNARKYSLIIILIQFLALGFATRLNANFSALNLKNGDIIAIQGKDKNSFCHANKHFQLVCNKKNKITEKSLFKIKIISAEENIIALSVGPDFNNYCQYDESSKRVLCDYEEEQPGSWEWFQWVPVKKNNLLENMFALKSGTTGYKSFCGQNNNNVTCDKKYINDQGTTFQYYILQKGKSNQNKFLDLAKILENDYQRELDSDSIVLEAREESTENEKSKAEAPKNIEKKKNSFKPVLSATGEEEEEESGDEEDESGDEGVSEL